MKVVRVQRLGIRCFLGECPIGSRCLAALMVGAVASVAAEPWDRLS